MSSKADQQPAHAGKHNNPANKKFSGPLNKLVAAEKRIKNVEGKLHSKLAQKRVGFAQEFCSAPSGSEELVADWEATVERALNDNQEHEAKERHKEVVQDEDNRDQFAEGVLALAEKFKQRKKPAQAESVAKPSCEKEVEIVWKPKRKSIVKLELPLQFDCVQNIFIDSKKQPSRNVPLRFADVIIAWFAHDPTTSGKLKRKLSYAEIGYKYLLGIVRKKAPATATEADLKVRLENRLKPGKGPESYATRFATDFTKWIKNYGLDGGSLFANDKTAMRYIIVGTGWHRSQPLIKRGEASKRRAVAGDG